jgi:hypothetical protein
VVLLKPSLKAGLSEKARIKGFSPESRTFKHGKLKSYT